MADDPGTPPDGTPHTEAEKTVLKASAPLRVDPVAQRPKALSFGDRYEIERELGRGGMGAVHLLRDHQIGRRVAAKTLRLDRSAYSGAETRFLREARVQGQLEHPSIVPVYDLGVDPEGRVYFTMKRVQGSTLSAVVRGLASGDSDFSEQYNRRRLLTAFSRLCLALDYAHTRGVIHRDLKPANVMLGAFGEVYVLDWGLARADHDPESDDAISIAEPASGPVGDTQPGAVMGTPGYMAPEQLAGQSVDGRADVYSLGAILFELLALQPLHLGDTADERAASTHSGGDARLSVRVPDVELEPELEAICLRATAQRPADRFAHARDLSEAIESFLDGQRDERLRKEMAAGHRERAAMLAERARGKGRAAIKARRVALGELGRALALDPNDREALSIMVEILGHPPAETPPEVDAAMDARLEEHYRGTSKVAVLAYLSLFLYLPLLAWAGLRSATWTVLFCTLSLTAAGLAVHVAYRRSGSAVIPMLAALVASDAAMSSTGMLFGPLFIMPAIVAVNSAGFAVALGRKYRWAIAVAGTAAVLVPLLLDTTGVLGPSYRFTTEGIVVLAQAIDLGRAPSLILLTVVNVSAVLTATITVSALQGSLSEAERRMLTYNWHLQQLVPEASESSIDPGGSISMAITRRGRASSEDAATASRP